MMSMGLVILIRHLNWPVTSADLFLGTGWRQSEKLDVFRRSVSTMIYFAWPIDDAALVEVVYSFWQAIIIIQDTDYVCV